MAVKKKAAKKTSGGAKNAPLIALYGFDLENERGRLLRRGIKELGFGVRVVAPEQLANPVGYVAGLVGYRAALRPFAGDAPEGEFMLMCNLTSTQLDDFLMALKIMGVKVDRKATLTKFNRDWTFGQLIAEVSEEHDTLTAAAECDK